MVEDLHCSPETTTTLLIGYTPIQNKSLKFGKKGLVVGKWQRFFTGKHFFFFKVGMFKSLEMT